jgi:hypothetical protein
MSEKGAFIFITYLYERKPHDKTDNMRRAGIIKKNMDKESHE